MKLECEINAIIEAQFNRDTVIKIIKRGHDLNIQYFDYIVGIRYANAPTIDVEQTVDKILYGQKSIDNFHATYIKIADTQCHLFFKPLPNNQMQVAFWVLLLGRKCLGIIYTI